MFPAAFIFIFLGAFRAFILKLCHLFFTCAIGSLIFAFDHRSSVKFFAVVFPCQYELREAEGVVFLGLCMRPRWATPFLLRWWLMHAVTSRRGASLSLCMRLESGATGDSGLATDVCSCAWLLHHL